MIKEIWKPTSIYGKYQVSNLGRIKSFKQFNKGKILKLRLNNNGYLCVNLNENGKSFFEVRFISELVLTTFVGPRSKGKVASHLNGIRTDNRLCNLKWETQKENLNRVTRPIIFKISLFGFEFIFRRLK